MKKIFLIILFLFVTFFSGCSNNPEPEATVVSISVIESTIPERILVSELDEKLSMIQLDVTLSNGETKKINVDKSMIFPHDIEKLQSGGKFKVKITYEYTTTEVVLNTFLVFPINYSITLLKPDGSPFSDVDIVLKNSNNIDRSLTTDVNGICSIELNPDKYTFKIELFDKGIAYFKTDCVLDADNPSKTIRLINVLDLSEGDGSNFNPYIVGCGFYNLIYEQGSFESIKYYKFTAPESKVYTIESISYSNYTNKSVDPYLTFIDNEGNLDKSGNLDSTINVDFKYSFEAEAGKTYKFMIFISTASEYPVNLLLKID